MSGEVYFVFAFDDCYPSGGIGDFKTAGGIKHCIEFIQANEVARYDEVEIYTLSGNDFSMEFWFIHVVDKNGRRSRILGNDKTMQALPVKSKWGHNNLSADSIDCYEMIGELNE